MQEPWIGGKASSFNEIPSSESTFTISPCLRDTTCVSGTLGVKCPLKMKPLSAFMRPEVVKAHDEAGLAPYRSMTPQQRARLLVSLCRSSTELVIARGVRLKPSREPAPGSTQAILNRMRADYRSRHAPR